MVKSSVTTSRIAVGRVYGYALYRLWYWDCMTGLDLQKSVGCTDIVYGYGLWAVMRLGNMVSMRIFYVWAGKRYSVLVLVLMLSEL